MTFVSLSCSTFGMERKYRRFRKDRVRFVHFPLSVSEVHGASVPWGGALLQQERGGQEARGYHVLCDGPEGW